MDGLKIERLRELCEAGQLIWSSHMMKRLLERGISREDVKSCIMTGEPIEQYPIDYPYPSCLVFGYTCKNKVLHVVVGEGQDQLWIVTAYWPDPEKWDKSLKIRREKQP